LFQGVSQILANMPAICDLFGLGRSLCRTISIGSSSISADNLNFGVGSQPLFHAFGFAIGQKIKDLMAFEVNDDRAVAFSSLPREIINANGSHLLRCWCWKELEGVQQRYARDLNATLLAQACATLPIKSEAKRLNQRA
jgi:hypothetical protein